MSMVGRKNYGPSKRIPIGILCDISGSMEDVLPILNTALGDLFDRIKKNKKFEKGVDLLLIFFNGTVDIKVDFETLEGISSNALKIEKVFGYTDTGKALLEATKLLDEKKKAYKLENTQYYQPNLFLITDGYPSAWLNAPKEESERINASYKIAAETISRLVREKKLVFASAGIQKKGKASANMAKLKELSPNAICISEDISGMKKIEEFFQLIDATITRPETEINVFMHELMMG